MTKKTEVTETKKTEVTARKTARDIAKQKLVFSELMNGREKMETEDVLAAGELTLIDFELVQKGNKEFCVCIFEEDLSKFYMGGMVLTDLCRELKDELGDDYSAVLSGDGGIPLKFEEVKSATKGENGMYNTYIKINVI